ncbi:hypothetical protein H4S07_001629, partial [Coemansia furcata]
NYTKLLLPLIPQGKENDKNHIIAIGSWIHEAIEILDTSETPAKWHVLLALSNIPTTKATQYHQWCTDNEHDSKNDWASLEEFLYKEYSGVISALDAYAKWKTLQAPRSMAELETFTEKFQLLAKMAQLDANMPILAMEFIMCMPDVLFQCILAESTNMNKLSLPALIAMASAHFRLQEVHRNTSMDNHKTMPMEVDALTSHMPCSLPHYSLIKDMCTPEQYKERANNNLCLGCGGQHCFKDCKSHPKGHKD